MVVLHIADIPKANGIRKSNHSKKSQEILAELISYIPPLPLPINAAEHYADIRCQLAKQGQMIGNNDLWIAAHALSLKLTLITNKLKEFKRVPLLKLENWV